MKNIGKPDAGKLHVRFDEGGQGETYSLLYPIHDPDPEVLTMYKSHFGLTSPPFSTPQAPTPMHLSIGQREAHDHLHQGITAKAGFSKLTGDGYTGKSMVLRALLSGLDCARYAATHVAEPSLQGVNLQRSINRRFGLPATEESTRALLKEFEGLLHKLGDNNREAVLAVDDAHLMGPAELEDIRLLANLAGGKGSGLHIIFSGRSDLNETLDRSELRQLQQRISVRAKLSFMLRAECDDYIGCRFIQVGGKCDNIVNGAALSRIYAYTKGNPRMVDILCDRAMTVAFFNNKKPITPAIVDSAIKELLQR